MKKIIRLFEDGNVCVCGLRGRGKDMLMANVVVRRNKSYVSNTPYDSNVIPFVPMDFDCGKNTYDDFINGTVKQYMFPYKDGTDIYIGDAGIVFPSQYCNELNKKYGYFSTFMALSRHLGECNVHVNVQNLNRIWDKIREQSDIYIMCNGLWRWLLRLTGIVVQCVTIYELYDSAVKRVPPFRVPKPWFNAERLQQWRLAKQQYDISYGYIDRRWLIYRNKSNYNTRIYKEVLANGVPKKANS